MDHAYDSFHMCKIEVPFTIHYSCHQSPHLNERHGLCFSQPKYVKFAFCFTNKDILQIRKKHDKNCDYGTAKIIKIISS